MLTDAINSLARQCLGRCVSLRRRIHRFPELAFQEHRTAKLVSEVLCSLGLEPQSGVAGTGVVALLQGAAPGRTVLLRADMDALPIQERVDLPFRSRIPNRMHACGHDGHVAGLLGAAMVLSQVRPHLKGQVKLVFQPAEERGGGAARMIEQGILEDPPVDAAFGCHLWGDLPEGRVQVRPGPLMAAPDGFRFRIQGVGGHGSAPHQTVDPVLLGVQAISFMQGIVSRRVNPLDPAVLSVCSVHAGDCDNVIPDALEATGTVRAFDDDLRDFIAREMERILAGVTAPWGATYTFEYRKSNPPLVNDPAMAELLARAFEQSLGPGNVIRLGSPTMGSEDFAYIAQKVPSAFALVGIARDGKTPMPHHQGEFQWDDRNLLPLIRGLAQVAADFLA